MSQEIFQYDSSQSTVTVGNDTFDTLALDAFIRRAWSAYNKGAKYVMGAIQAPDNAVVDSDTAFDCSGFCWWTTFRKRLGLMQSNQYWIQIPEPIAGACIRYDPKPGQTYGHAGFIVRVYDDGDYDSLESSDSYGGIKLRERAGKSFWNKQPNYRWLVPPDALYTGAPLNIMLSLYKRPTTSIVGGVAIVIALAFATTAIVKSKYYD